MKKIGNSFKGILGGFVIIIIGIGLLWWNEGNNVKNLKTTAEAAKSLIDVKRSNACSKLPELYSFFAFTYISSLLASLQI